jgi:CRP/FNR family transcriptional regulator, cyclic AMP receptor protein
MHIPTKQSESISLAALKCRNLTEALLEELTPSGTTLDITYSIDIFAELPNTCLFRIGEGYVNYSVRNKLVTVFEEGDLIGLPRSLGMNDGLYNCSEACSLIPYNRDQLVTHVNSDPKRQKNWAYYLICQQHFYHQALAQEIRSDFQPQAGFLHYQQGDIIIHQGDMADKVYTLLEGSADAVCDGVKVGDVHASEIFGALAVFTRQPRMASVVATSDCLVLAVRKEEFVDLIDHQPQICMNLIEEMAAKINQLNSQLLTKQ